MAHSTTRGYIATRLLSFPFWGLFNLLPIILYKDLHATPFQIATIVALKPLSALFSTYWSARIHSKGLVSNLFWAHILKFIPFLFFPFFHSIWFIIFSFGFYMVFMRGTVPAWVEVLKMHVPPERRSKICSIGLVIEYLGAGLLPFSLGWLLDHRAGSWQWIFPLTAVLGMLSSLFILKFPPSQVEASLDRTRLLQRILEPWKSSWKILSEKKDFRIFLIGFFIGGAGLMIMQAVLPKYFVDDLDLSYTDMILAIAVCKGIGFALSSPIWVKLFNRSKIYSFSCIVTLFAGLSLLLLMLAGLSTACVYLGFFIYGVMQGGSELSWKMSGIVFSKEQSSTPFSSVNVLATGTRGAIFPYLASLLCIWSTPFFVLMIGMLFCLAATLLMWRYREREVVAVALK